MPRALDPRQRFPIILDSDKGKEPECRFWFRYLSGAEFMQVDETAGRTKDSTSDVEYQSYIYTALRIGLVDWDNLIDKDGTPIPYQPANLECIVDPVEAVELLAKLRAAVAFGVLDSKKSESQSASEQEPSADSVAESATTSQQRPSPSKSNAPSAKGRAAKIAMVDISA